MQFQCFIKVYFKKADRRTDASLVISNLAFYYFLLRYQLVSTQILRIKSSHLLHFAGNHLRLKEYLLASSFYPVCENLLCPIETYFSLTFSPSPLTQYHPRCNFETPPVPPDICTSGHLYCSATFPLPHPSPYPVVQSLFRLSSLPALLCILKSLGSIRRDQ